MIKWKDKRTYLGEVFLDWFDGNPIIFEFYVPCPGGFHSHHDSLPAVSTNVIANWFLNNVGFFRIYKRKIS